MFKKNCLLFVALSVTLSNTILAADAGEKKEKPVQETEASFAKDKPTQVAFLGTGDRVLKLTPVISKTYGVAEFVKEAAIGKCADKDRKIYHVHSEDMISNFSIAFSKKDGAVAIKFVTPAKNNQPEVASFLSVLPVATYQWAYFTTPEYAQQKYRADFKLIKTIGDNFKIVLEDKGQKSYLMVDEVNGWVVGAGKPYFASEEYLKSQGKKPTTFWLNGIEVPKTHYELDEEAAK